MTAPPFVGRTAEVDALDAAIADARSGRPRAVLLRGDAGIGKSRLVRTLVERHPDGELLIASCDESDSLLSFGVLGQLWPRGADGASPAQAGANPHDVGALLLRELGRADSRGLTICVVDDIQWGDDPSLRALTFAVRRAVAEHLLLVLVHRDGPDTQLHPVVAKAVTDGVMSQVRLAGLSGAEVAALAGGGLSRPVPASLAQQLHAHTGGNPLYLLALIDELDPTALDTLGDPLPVPRSYAATILDRLHRCDDAAVRLARVSAVLGIRCPVAEAAAQAGLAEPTAALDQLTAAGLAKIDAGSGVVGFTHPLVRAAIYHDLTNAQRTQLHRAAAAVATTPAQALHHRIAGTAGADDALAAELSSFAARQVAALQWSVAADAYRAAVRTASERRIADAAILGLAECLIFAGRSAECSEMMPQVAAVEDCPGKFRLLGFVALMTGESRDAEHLLTRAWDGAHAAHDEAMAAKAASDLALLALTAGHAQQAVDWSHQALAAAPTPVEHGTARAILATARAELGQFADGLAEVADVPDDMSRFQVADVGGLLGRGMLHLYQDDIDGAVRDLGRVDLIARSSLGLFSIRVNALLHLADAEYRQGSWDQAITHAELATSLSDASGAVHTLGLAHAVASFPASARGAWGEAEEHLRAAEIYGQANGDMATRFYISVAEMRLEFARANPAGVAEAGAAITAMVAIDGVDEPGLQPWKSMYAHALVDLGRLDEAAEIVEGLRRRAEVRGNGRALARAHRVRAELLSAKRIWRSAHAAFLTALEHTDAADRGLDAALLHLEFGTFLAARGERRQAAEHLGHAAGSLRRLGAAPYLRRCQNALSAVEGGRTPPAADDVRSLLTSQELAVATLVATGLSNREVATQLVVSHKTIEYHLGNVYRKLGVSSRTKLSLQLTRP